MISNERFKELNRLIIKKCHKMTSSLSSHLHRDENIGSTAQQVKV